MFISSLSTVPIFQKIATPVFTGIAPCFTTLEQLVVPEIVLFGIVNDKSPLEVLTTILDKLMVAGEDVAVALFQFPDWSYQVWI